MVGALLHRSHGVLDRSIRRHHDDRPLGVLLLDGLEKLQAIAVRQHHVQDDKIGILFLDQCQSIPGARGEQGLVAGPAEETAENILNHRLVVHDNDPGRWGGRGRGRGNGHAATGAPCWAGKCTVKRLPLPGVEWT